MDNETSAQIWQSNGALEILLSTLMRVERGTAALLAKDGSLIAQIKAFVAEHFEPLAAAGFQGQVEDEVSQETLNKGAAMGLAIGNLAATLSCDLRTANVMAAVDLEAAVDQFLVLHLSERVVESIDRISVSAKLTIAQAILGVPDFAGSREEKAISELFDWRNAFAHGKLPGFKKNLSLRMLHLKTL